MSVERYATEYNMKHKKRGIALIFNHEHFDSYSLKTRAGTNVDAENLFQTLIGLNFEVRIRKDFRFSEIHDEIREGLYIEIIKNQFKKKLIFSPSTQFLKWIIPTMIVY